MKTATTTSPPTPSMMEALSAKLRQPTLVRTVTTTVVGAAIFSLCMCDPFGLPTRGTLGSLAWVFTYSTLKPNIGPSEYGKLIDGSIKFLLLLCLCSVLAMAMVASSRGHPEALMAWTSVLAVFYCAIASWDSSWFGAGVVCALMTYLFAFIPYSQAPPWSEKYPTRELQFHVQWVVLTGSITSVLTSATLGIAVACGVHGLVLPDFGCVKWRRGTAAVLSSTAKLLDDVAARAIITSARRVDVDSPARLAQSMGTIRGQLAALSPALGAARLEWRFFSPRRGQLASQLQVAVQVAVGHALENATAAAQAGHTMSKHLGADEPLQAACQRTLQESRNAITDLATALGTGGAKGTQPAEPLPPPFPVGESLSESLDEALGAALRRVAHKSDDAIEQLVTAHQAAAFHVTLRSLRAATTRLSAAGKAFVGEPEVSIFSPAGWAALRAEWAATCPVPRRPRAASDLLVASPLAPVSRHRHLLRSFMAFLSSERATTAWKVALALVLTSMWGFFEWANPVYVKMGGVSAIASVVTLSVSPQVGALGWKAVAKVAGNLVAVAFAFVWYGLFVSTGTAAAQDSGGDIGSGAPTDTGLRDAEEFLSDPLLLGGMVLFQGLLQAACCLFVAAYPSMSYAAYITVIMWVTATNKKLTPSGQNGAQLVSFAVYARTVSIELLGAATGLCMAFLTCSLINPTWGYASVSNALAEVAATCQAALVHANELRRGGATQKDSAAAIARARLLVQELAMRRAQLLARRGELMVFLWASGKEVNLEPQAHYSPAKAMQLYAHLFRAYDYVQLLMSGLAAQLAASPPTPPTQPGPLEKEGVPVLSDRVKESTAGGGAEGNGDAAAAEIVSLHREHLIRLRFVESALRQRVPLLKPFAGDELHARRSGSLRTIRSALASRLRQAARYDDKAFATRQLVDTFATVAHLWHGEQLHEAIRRCEAVTMELYGPHAAAAGFNEVSRV